MTDANTSDPKDDGSQPEEVQDSGEKELSEKDAKKKAIQERNKKWQENTDQHSQMGYPF